MDDTVKHPAPGEDFSDVPTAPDLSGEDAELRATLATAKAEDRVQLLREVVRSRAETILKTPLTEDSNFLENGLNSLTALELTKTLINATGIELPMVAIVENPTPADLSQQISMEFEATVKQ